jgi:hypothetical protein
MESYLRRKANTPTLLDEDDTPLLRLLRDLFIENGAPYCIKELAADLGVSVFAVYKMFGADRPLRAETLLHIINFVNFKDPADTRLLDFICDPCGYMAMPKTAKVNIKAVREILALAQELTKKEG